MDFGNLINEVVGGGHAGVGDAEQQKGVAGALMNMIQQHGGVGGLTDHLRNNGLGQQVDSWISTGQNQPVDPQQVQAGLGQDGIQNIAQKAGINPQLAAGIAAIVLPMIVDRLTPNGQVPQGGGLGGMLGGILGRR